MMSMKCGTCYQMPCVCYRIGRPGRLSEYELQQLSNDELTELLISVSKIVKERLTVVRTSSSTTTTPISMHNLRPNLGEFATPEETKNA